MERRNDIGGPFSKVMTKSSTYLMSKNNWFHINTFFKKLKVTVLSTLVKIFVKYIVNASVFIMV